MKFHHTTISVKNLETSIKFYTDVLGFSVAKRFERADLGGKAAFLNLNGVYLEIWEFDKQIQNADDLDNLNVLGYKHIGFIVENLEVVSAELKMKSVVVGEPQKGKTGMYLFFKDPDGLPLELIEPYEKNLP